MQIKLKIIIYDTHIYNYSFIAHDILTENRVKKFALEIETKNR